MSGTWKWYQNQAKLKIDQNRDAGYMKMVSKSSKTENWSKSWCQVYENGIKIKQNWKLFKIVMPGMRKWYQNQAKLKTDQNRDAGYLNSVKSGG